MKFFRKSQRNSAEKPVIGPGSSGRPWNRGMLVEALRLTSPVFFGYVAIGIPFGLMVVEKGYPWWCSPLMSLVMYTGAGQYIAIGMFASGAGLLEVLVAQLLLSVRHLFYGFSMIQKFSGTGCFKPYLIYAMSDETYAILSSLNDGVAGPDSVQTGKGKGAFYALVALLDQSYWVLGTVIGALLCSILQQFNVSQYLKGIDFALTALFITMFIDSIRKSRQIFPSVAGICSAVLMVVLYRFGLIQSANIILLSICAGLGVTAIFKAPAWWKEQGNLSAYGDAMASSDTNGLKSETGGKENE